MSYSILTVDDSRMVRMLIRRTLAGCDLQIAEAGNGVEGLAAAQSQAPDLVLLDVTMPGMDGLEMLSQLRKVPACARIPVIMLTAESSREYVARADGLGVVGYVAKPFKEEALREQILQTLANTGTAAA